MLKEQLSCGMFLTRRSNTNKMANVKKNVDSFSPSVVVSRRWTILVLVAINLCFLWPVEASWFGQLQRAKRLFFGEEAQPSDSTTAASVAASALQGEQATRWCSSSFFKKRRSSCSSPVPRTQTQSTCEGGLTPTLSVVHRFCHLHTR